MVNRDLKHLSAKPKTQAKKRRSGASRAAKRRQPGWLLLAVGLVIGLAIAAVAYFSLRERQASLPPTETEPVVKAPPVVAPSPEQEAVQEEAERFEFYHLLSQLEVVIPESEVKALQAQIAPKEDVTYLIQAGSFRHYDDADSVKAQLALLGVEAEVQKVASRGVDWYRVRVGPFASSRQLNKVRNRIHAADINTMVIKVRKEG